MPGPSAVTAALSVAGLATDRFCFEGFLPARAQGRRERLETLRTERRTLVVFESVHRISDTLDDMAAAFGAERLAAVARELTKLHEELVRAPLGNLAEMAKDGAITHKGEFVIVVAGAAVDAGSDDESIVDALLGELIGVLPGKQAAAIVARVTGESRNSVYQRMLDIKQKGKE